ncbi:MAG TPA: peptidase T [Bacteroidales bacterium]|jgi:tripeptide aminopeptidase|nr:peptidase T [Bacteroidales bacterium]
MDKLVERFIRYVKVNTRSDENSKTWPSTPGQITLANMLAEELREIGLSDVSVDEYAYVMATLPENIENKVPVIGFLAHLDTSPDFKSDNVNPRITEHTGKPIILNKKENIVLSPVEFPVINNYIGQKLITTDGTTLLGADDKAGIAEIVTAMEYLITHPAIRHGKVRIGFTPDEEIGRGADKFNVQEFNADFAYTMDGSGPGEIEFENFNAARARIVIQGLNVHPGYAKNKLKNSTQIAMELSSMLPAYEVPEHTEGYEGFFHLTEINGTVESTTLNYIIRDHDLKQFNKKKDLLIKIVDHLNLKYGARTVKLTMIDQYYNMKAKIEPVFHIIELAKRAISDLGMTPKMIPVRGGTDGSRLSYMGLPCPNLFAGGHNFHSRYEFVPIKSMEKAVEVIVKIITMNAEEIRI